MKLNAEKDQIALKLEMVRGEKTELQKTLQKLKTALRCSSHTAHSESRTPYLISTHLRTLFLRFIIRMFSTRMEMIETCMLTSGVLASEKEETIAKMLADMTKVQHELTSAKTESSTKIDMLQQQIAQFSAGEKTTQSQTMAKERQLSELTEKLNMGVTDRTKLEHELAANKSALVAEKASVRQEMSERLRVMQELKSCEESETTLKNEIQQNVEALSKERSASRVLRENKDRLMRSLESLQLDTDHKNMRHEDFRMQMIKFNESLEAKDEKRTSKITALERERLELQERQATLLKEKAQAEKALMEAVGCQRSLKVELQPNPSPYPVGHSVPV